MTKYVIYTGEAEVMTEEEVLIIKPKLETIRDSFEPDMFEPVVSTQYITATYNRENPTKTLDGVTVEMILAYEVPIVEEPTQPEGE